VACGDSRLEGVGEGEGHGHGLQGGSWADWEPDEPLIDRYKKALRTCSEVFVYVCMHICIHVCVFVCVCVCVGVCMCVCV
jgi:hypothetical protein